MTISGSLPVKFVLFTGKPAWQHTPMWIARICLFLGSAALLPAVWAVITFVPYHYPHQETFLVITLISQLPGLVTWPSLRRFADEIGQRAVLSPILETVLPVPFYIGAGLLSFTFAHVVCHGINTLSANVGLWILASMLGATVALVIYMRLRDIIEEQQRSYRTLESAYSKGEVKFGRFLLAIWKCIKRR